MNLSRIVPASIVAGMSVLLLAACTPPQPPSPASDSPSQAVTSSPSIEPTAGLESPQSPGSGGGGAVAISVAPLPTGKNGNTGDNDECVQIAWLGQPITHGDVVTVTAVAVQQPFTFDQGVTAHCADGPSCSGYRFSAANNNNGPFCNVGLGYTGGTLDLGNGTLIAGSLQLTGQLGCPGADSAACRHDAAALQGSGIPPISFEVGVDVPGSPGSGSSSPAVPSSP